MPSAVRELSNSHEFYMSVAVGRWPVDLSPHEMAWSGKCHRCQVDLVVSSLWWISFKYVYAFRRCEGWKTVSQTSAPTDGNAC